MSQKKPPEKKTRQDDGLPQHVKCPQCGEISPYRGNPYRPFCSERCQTLDQAAWAEEKFVLPSEDSVPLDDSGDG